MVHVQGGPHMRGGPDLGAVRAILELGLFCACKRVVIRMSPVLAFVAIGSLHS